MRILTKMPITASINRDARIRIHDFYGRTTAREVSQLMAYYAAHPSLAHTDVFHFVDPDAEIAVEPHEIEHLRSALQSLQRRVDPVVILRSAWICPNVGAWAFLEKWLADRHPHDGLAIENTMAPSLEAAAHLFEPNEIDLVRRRRGFDVMRRFEDA